MATRSVIRSVFGGVALCSLHLYAVAQSGSPWTPTQSIEMQYFASPEGGNGESNVIHARDVVSPDRERFFVVTRRGDLKSDCNVYELRVFLVRAVRQALAARRTAFLSPYRTTSACSQDASKPGIYDARWTEDSAAIVFLSTSGAGPRQVQRWELLSNKVSNLTTAELGVDSFDFHRDGLTYRAILNTGVNESLYHYPSTPIGETTDWQRAFGIQLRTYALFATTSTSRPCQVGSPSVGEKPEQQVFVSPNGRWAIAAVERELATVPRAWRGYRNVAGNSTGHFIQYRTIDLRTCEDHAAIDAPMGQLIDNQSAAQVLWAPDSAHAILINTLLPISAAREERQQTSYVVDFEWGSRTWDVVATLPGDSTESLRPGLAPVTRAGWIEGGSSFALVSADRRTVYRRRHSRWTSVASYPATVPEAEIKIEGMTIEIRQDLNDPPRLVASSGGRQMYLSEDDSALEGTHRVAVEPLEWRDARGGVWDGLLVYPDQQASKRQRFPLILQAASHVFPHQFLPDGGLSAGFAAQTMVARGFAVLTVHVSGPGHKSIGSGEGPAFVAGIDAAIDTLNDHALVDPARVGLIGFSRTGYLTNYAIAHQGKYRLAAAIIQDSFNASYVQYLYDGATNDGSSWQLQYEGQYQGGGSFWGNTAAWLQDAPGFNPERIQTPALFTEHGAFTAGLLGVLESYAGLRMLHKPVAVIALPGADHTLLRPGHRRAAMEAAMDWMSFWLEEQEDPDPAKKEQYDQWRQLRQSQVPMQ